MTGFRAFQYLVLTLLFLLAASVPLNVTWELKPVFLSGTVALEDAEPVEMTLPYFGEGEPGMSRAKMQFDVPLPSASVFLFQADDCIEEIMVNGTVIQGLPLPNCAADIGLRADLGGFLRRGTNEISVRFGNGGGPTSLLVRADPTDPKLLALAILFVVLAAGYGAGIASLRRLDFTGLMEHALMGTLIGGKVWAFLQIVNHAHGFDIDAHLEMVDAVRFGATLPLTHSFLSYHPPLGFLLARAFSLMGAGHLLGVQIAALGSAVVAVFALRFALKYAGVLQTPFGMAFLAIAGAMPLFVYLGASVNLDVGVLALAAVTLCASLRLSWNPPVRRETRWIWMLILGTALSAAVLVKFSGIVLFALPLFAWLIAPMRSKSGFTMLSGCMLAAVVFTAPYYLARYQLPTGSLFPGNAGGYLGPRHVRALKERDADRRGFVYHLVLPDPLVLLPQVRDIPLLKSHDYGSPRLADTWRDFWIADGNPLEQIPWSVAVSFAYMVAAPWILLFGIAHFVSRRHAKDGVFRFASLMLAFAVLFLLALAKYAFDFPDPGFKPTKGIYASPAVWGVAALLAIAFTGMWPKSVVRSRIATGALMIALFAFVIVNHVLPVY